jgi:hypothetical protein
MIRALTAAGIVLQIILLALVISGRISSTE